MEQEHEEWLKSLAVGDLVTITERRNDGTWETAAIEWANDTEFGWIPWRFSRSRGAQQLGRNWFHVAQPTKLELEKYNKEKQMHPAQDLEDKVSEERPLMEKKTWADFYETGFLMYINQILHLFGWAITYSYNDDGTIAEVYPARVRFRGFTEDVVENNYRKMSQYMKNNADVLLEEASE